MEVARPLQYYRDINSDLDYFGGPKTLSYLLRPAYYVAAECSVEANSFLSHADWVGVTTRATAWAAISGTM